MLIDFKAKRDDTAAFIVPVADVHAGADECLFDKFVGYIEWVRTKSNAYIIMPGDLFETNNPDSVSEVYTRTRPRDAYKMVKEILHPVKSKIIAACEGNHEYRSTKRTDNNMLMQLCEDFNIPYSDDFIDLKFTVGKYKYRIRTSHGNGSAQTIGGRINKLTKIAGVQPQVDVIVCGHTHNPSVAVDCWFDTSGKPRKRFYCGTGSCLGYSTYAARSSMQPTWPGYPRIRFDNLRHDVHISL